MGETTDHDRLIRMETKLDDLIAHFENHLRHHFWTRITLISLFGGLLVTLILNLL